MSSELRIKTMAALKNHIMKNHQTDKNKCSICGFESNESDMEDHNRQFHLVHENLKSQNKRKKVTFGCDECGVTVDSENKLKDHKDLQHAATVETSSSPEPSPPRKKPTKLVEVPIVAEAKVDRVDILKETDTEVEMIDEEQTNNDLQKDELIMTQAKTIEDQAKELVVLKEISWKQIKKREQSLSMLPI